MPYPAGITTRTVTLGGATALESADPLILQAIIQSSRGLIWGATGWRFPSLARTVTSTAGGEITVSLPVTDLPGWRLIDAEGSILDVSAPGSYTHTYTVTLVALTSANRIVSSRVIGPFVLPTGDGSPIDLDTLLPVGTQAGGVVLVPDTWGPMVAAAEAAATDVANTLTTTDAGVASFVGDGASATAAALSARHARVTQIIANGTDQTTAINAALATPGTPGSRATVRLVGNFTITDTLVIHSHTTLDATDATITQGNSARRMLQNAALGGAGARDAGIRVIGGTWDRTIGGSGTDGNQVHSLVMHRADDVAITDVQFIGAGTIKYAIYGVDVTGFRVERCDITSTSDGVHITGPASDITIRDIAGDTEDDLVSFTGRDYVTYELTAGGGDISRITVERINLRSGDGNTVKLLPGASKTLTGATVRGITGNPVNSSVVIYSDSVDAATTGGTVRDVLIDGVSGAPSVNGYMINVAHPDVNNLTIRNLMVSSNASPRVVAFSGSGGVAGQVIIDGITSTIAYTGSYVHVGTGYTVADMKLSNVAAMSGVGVGPIVQVSGTLSHLHGANIRQFGGRTVVNVDGVGLCPLMSFANLAASGTHGVFINNAAASCEVHLSGVTVMPTNQLVYVNAGSAFLRGTNLLAATSHIGKTAGTIRATGRDVRVAISTLTPQDGDAVYNTVAIASTNIPVGPVVRDGRWRSAAGAVASFTRGIDFPEIAAGGQQSLTHSYSGGGIVTGDDVRVIPPATLEAGLSWDAWVSSADNITTRLTNHTAAPINPAPGTWGFRVS